jgi:hypothetical protein
MLNYTNQPPISLFDNVAVTAAYTGNRKEFTVAGFSKLSLDIDYERGDSEAGSKLVFTLEHSTDGVNWHNLVIDNTSTVSQISAREWEIADTASLNVLIDIAYLKLRMSIKEDDVSANAGTATVVATLSGL